MALYAGVSCAGNNIFWEIHDETGTVNGVKNVSLGLWIEFPIFKFAV